MGAWGKGAFDNDSAIDWLHLGLLETGNLEFLHGSLFPQELDGEYLEVEGGEQVIAAAEIIHALHLGPRVDLPEEAHQWVTQHKGLDVSAIVPDAVASLQRVLGENSEIGELWGETDEYKDWLEDVEALRDSLAGKA